LSLAIQREGPLTRVFAELRDEANAFPTALGIVRMRLLYEGPTTAPFSVYMRWQPGRLTIADISAKGPSRQGRMTPLCEAIECLGRDVRFEGVINADLYRFLRRRGYEGRTLGGDLIRRQPLLQAN
jgi:hypothetical protein